MATAGLASSKHPFAPPWSVSPSRTPIKDAEADKISTYLSISINIYNIFHGSPVVLSLSLSPWQASQAAVLAIARGCVSHMKTTDGVSELPLIITARVLPLLFARSEDFMNEFPPKSLLRSPEKEMDSFYHANAHNKPPTAAEYPFETQSPFRKQIRGSPLTPTIHPMVRVHCLRACSYFISIAKEVLGQSFFFLVLSQAAPLTLRTWKGTSI